MLATLMIVFALNGSTHTSQLLSPSIETCKQDSRVVAATLHVIGATDIHVECTQ